MNELTITNKQLPNTVEDLAKFVLVGREALKIVRAKIKTIEKVGLAREVHEQKLAEAQDIAEAVLDAEVRLGELTAQMEKANNGGANQFQAKRTTVSEKRTKTEQLEEIGVSEKQKQRYEKIAKHPKAVEGAKKNASEEGRVVSRQDVLDLIADPPAKKQTPQEHSKQVDRDHMGWWRS